MTIETARLDTFPVLPGMHPLKCPVCDRTIFVSIPLSRWARLRTRGPERIHEECPVGHKLVAMIATSVGDAIQDGNNAV